MLCQFHHLVVTDGIHPGQMGREHIDLCCLLNSFNQTKGLVHGLARAVNAMHSPNHQAEFLHLLRCGFADRVGAAEHPWKHAHAVREHYDALGTHLPQGMGELLLVQLVDIVHG